MNAAEAQALPVAERVTRAHAARVAAALGLSPSVVQGMAVLPLGWHWAFCLSVHGKDALAADGLAASDPMLPQMPGFAARVMGGTTLTLLQPIPMEAELSCSTRTVGIVDKSGRSGPLRILTIERRYSLGELLALQEQQEIVYLPSAVRPPEPAADAAAQPLSGEGVIAVDEIDVFRFSAVTFNGHRLHYDRPYATGVEAWPGLLVQAKLLALHALQACERAQGVALKTFSFRSLAPLLCPAQVQVDVADAGEGRVQATVRSASGVHLTALAGH